MLGIRVVKAFSGKRRRPASSSRATRAFLRIKESMYTWMAWFHSTTRLFDGLMYVMVLVMGGLFIHSGRIAAADLVAYMLYANMLLAAVRRMVEFTEQFQRGRDGHRAVCGGDGRAGGDPGRARRGGHRHRQGGSDLRPREL